MLYSAAVHSDAGHKCALPSCGFRGQKLVEKRRYGRKEVHLEWEQKDAVMPLLEHVVDNVCVETVVTRGELVNKLLCDKELVEALGQVKNIMKTEKRDTGPDDLSEIYKLIGKCW